jgi:Mn2+/Fe2+ NRAMP family transporter
MEQEAGSGTTATSGCSSRSGKNSPPAAPRRLGQLARIVGPGIVVAATGVGAGDLFAASKAGAAYGLPLLWTALLGALLKFALAEGVARWQLATGTTVLEGWVRIFGRAVHVYFSIYLVLWTFIVSAALLAACGLAAHALVPALSVEIWAVAHGLAALFFVFFRGYGALEKAMKIVVGVMFISILGSAAFQSPSLPDVIRGLVLPTVPPGSTLLILGAVGGVGGSLTLLSYNYWIREKGWSGPGWARGVRFDLGVGYLLTGLFGFGLILLGATVLMPRGIAVEGSSGVLDMAVILGERFGRAGELVFLAGFWGAVATSTLGVWQGIPYLFGNYVGLLRGLEGEAMEKIQSPRGRVYRMYVLFMTFPPMFLLLFDKPVWLIVIYAAVSALFMPFLAGTLLVMNNRRGDMGGLRNGILANLALLAAFALFVYLTVVEFGAKVFS